MKLYILLWILGTLPTAALISQSLCNHPRSQGLCLAASSSPAQDRVSVINMFVNVAAAILSVPRYALQPFGPPMVEPPPPSAAQDKRRQLVNALLETGFDATNQQQAYDVFSLPKIEEETDFAQFSTALGGSSPSTYGEVTTLGARQLFYFMGLSTTTGCKTDDAVFYDLGMGRGKLVVQAFLELDGVQKSCGVELSHTRYQAALVAWQTILSQQNVSFFLPDADERLGLYQGDLFQQDLTHATHIYVASLCFTDSMMQDLQTKLKGLPNLKCVASLKKLPSWMPSRSEYVEMTWTRPHGCQTYFYDL